MVTLLRVDPADTLVVERLDVNADQDEVRRTFTINNLIASNVCFKIRSTAPDRTALKPSCGYLRGLDDCEIVLSIKTESFAAGRSKEKLLISAVKCTVPPEDWDNIPPPKAWKLMSTSETFETKLVIKFKDRRSSTGDGPLADFLRNSRQPDNGIATPEKPSDLVFRSISHSPKALSEPDELSDEEERNGVEIDYVRLKNFVDGKGFDAEVANLAIEDKVLKIEGENEETKTVAIGDSELRKELMDLRNNIRGTDDGVLLLKRNVELASGEVEKNKIFIKEQIGKYDMMLKGVVKDFGELKDMKKNYAKQIEDLEKVMMNKVERMVVVQTDRCNNRFEDMLRRSLRLQEDKIKEAGKAAEVVEEKFRDRIKAEIRISEDKLVAIVNESSKKNLEDLTEVIERTKSGNAMAEIEKMIKGEIAEFYDKVKSEIRTSEAITMRMVDEKLQKSFVGKKDDVLQRGVDSTPASISIPQSPSKSSNMIMVGIATGCAISSSLLLLRQLLKK